MRARIFATALVLGLLLPGNLRAADKEKPQDDLESLYKKSAAELKVGIEDKHPGVYFVLAHRLFLDGKKDEATFWFYVGQLRFRFHLKSDPKNVPPGDPGLFSAFTELVGGPINKWAFGDTTALVKTLDDVLAWDAKTRNGFTSKEANAEALKYARNSIVELQKTIRDTAAQIRKDRAAAGWENRS